MPAAITPVTVTRHVRLCVFGDNGIGKTRLAATSPGRTLLLRPPTERTESILPVDKARVRQWVIRDHDDLQESLEYLREEGHLWDWVWLDNISIWQDHGLDDIWLGVLAERPSRARYDVDRKEYGINMARLARWVRHVTGPDNFNFGITAHAEMLKTSSDPEAPIRLMPWVQGRQMSQKICGYMNMVAFYEMAEVEVRGETVERRVLRVNKTDRYWALDGFDCLPRGRLFDPTMPKLIRAINESPARRVGVERRARPGSRPRVISKGRS